MASELETERLIGELRDIEKGIVKEIKDELRKVGVEVASVVRSSNSPPFGPSDSNGQIGRKRRSIKVSVRSGAVSLYSNEPDAGVWNWGGTIKPRGVPIKIPETNFLTGTVLAFGDKLDAKLGSAFERVAHRNGFL